MMKTQSLKFEVSVMVMREKKTVEVERILLTDQIQELRIGKPEKCVIIQNKQPEYTAKRKGLDFDWKIISGQENIRDARMFTTVIALINQKMRTEGKTTLTNGRVNTF